MSYTWGAINVSGGVNSTTFITKGTGTSGVLLGNESGLTIAVLLEGQPSAKTLYPSTVDFFECSSKWNGNLVLKPVANLSNASTWPSSFVQVDVFGIGEKPNGVYPLALVRNTNVGNTVNTALGSSTSVQNDNNVSGTSVVEATKSGSSASNLFADNAGNFYLAQFVSNVYTKIFQVVANGASIVIMGATGLLSEVLGSLKIDQSLTVTGTSSLNNNVSITGTLTASGSFNTDAATIFSDGVGDLTIVSLSTGSVATTGHVDMNNNVSIRMKDTGGVLRDIIYVDAANESVMQAASLGGLLILKDRDGTNIAVVVNNQSGGQTVSQGSLSVAKVFFNTGAIKDLTTGTVAINASSTATVNHGLTGTPSCVLICTDTSGSTATCGADSYTSTQFTARNGAGSLLTFRWFAFR